MTLALPRTSRQGSFVWQRWMRGLAGTPLNLAITLAFLLFSTTVLWPFVRWATFDAVWTGTAKDCAARSGACWALLGEKARFIVFGMYPSDRDWQAASATGLIALLLVTTAVPRFWTRHLPLLWIGTIALVVAILAGLPSGTFVGTEKWGGFPLTMLLSTVGFAGAFPLGIMLALGRRSKLRLVKLLSIAFIEALRGVPLIAVLYVATLLFPLMLPAGATIDKLARAQIAIVLFVSAYMAEIVRAGLQAVPTGQAEAARSLGLSWWATTRLVLLPQALRSVIPAFVNLAIGLFLDTTLVIVIGLFDFLNTARVAATDPNWIGFYNEAYAFAAAVYFTLAFAASRYSLWLEKRLRVGR